MNDLKFAFRQLLRSPGFTVVATLTPGWRIWRRASGGTVDRPSETWEQAEPMNFC